MLVLRDFMTRDVATLNPDDTLRDAITMLSERYISGAPVVAGEEVVGVVSAMDIMDFAATAGDVTTESAAEDEWDLDETPEEAASSYFTEMFDRETGLVEGDGTSTQDLLAEYTVNEVMTRSLLSLPPETEVHVAASFMIEHGVHRLLVVQDGRLHGLVTTMDFLRLIAERRL